MAVREYIGARYVPIFGREGEDSAEWDNSKPYEPLTIVLYGGNSYTSRQYVPRGVDITDDTYWASTGLYNAQVEQYRLEVRQFDARITDVERFGQVGTTGKLINAAEYDGIDPTGESDSTQGIQSVIDNATDGDTVFFKHGTYRFGSINLKSGVVYDFDGSTLEYTSNTGILCSGTMRDSYALGANYTSENKVVTLANSAGSTMTIGDIAVVENQNEFENHMRSYYYKGFTSVVEKIAGSVITLSNGIPYDITGNGAYLKDYSSVSVAIQNIGNMVYDGDGVITDLTGSAIHVVYGSNCSISNCNFLGKNPTCIFIENCFSTTIDRCNFIMPDDYIPDLNPQYGVSVAYSSFTTIHDCAGYNLWHVITTGGHGSVRDTNVTDCVLTSSSQVAYGDHENAISTKLTRVYANGGVAISPGGIVRDSYLISTDERRFALTFHGHTRQDVVYNNFIVDGCNIQPYDNKIGIRFFDAPQLDVNTIYYGDVSITNSRISKPLCVNVNAGYSIKYLTIDNTSNLIVRNSGNIDFLTMKNCHVTIADIPYTNFYQGNGICDYENVTFSISQIAESITSVMIDLIGNINKFVNCQFDTSDKAFFRIIDGKQVFVIGCNHNNFSDRNCAAFVCAKDVASGVLMIGNSKVAIQHCTKVAQLNVSNSIVNSQNPIDIRTILVDGTQTKCMMTNSVTSDNMAVIYTAINENHF